MFDAFAEVQVFWEKMLIECVSRHYLLRFSVNQRNELQYCCCLRKFTEHLLFIIERFFQRFWINEFQPLQFVGFVFMVKEYIHQNAILILLQTAIGFHTQSCIHQIFEYFFD